MDPEKRECALNDIRDNIARFGYHSYVVTGGQDPRFSYTIGLSPRMGRELIFAGGILFMYKEVGTIIRGIVERLTAEPGSERSVFPIEAFGTFTLRNCETSWSNSLMLGALDYYQKSDIPALQIIPDDEHWTIDVPDMSQPWSPQTAPVWRWLKEPWTYSIPKTSHAIADLALCVERP